jgi:hypothetical protein
MLLVFAVMSIIVQSMNERSITYTKRADIQALRGLAIALVVAGHAFPDKIPSGYIGVDVFFVISGWLITGMVISGQDAGNFRLVDFWGKRIRRLLPALYVVIAATIIMAWLVLGRASAGEPRRRRSGYAQLHAQFPVGRIGQLFLGRFGVSTAPSLVVALSRRTVLSRAPDPADAGPAVVALGFAGCDFCGIAAAET